MNKRKLEPTSKRIEFDLAEVGFTLSGDGSINPQDADDGWTYSADPPRDGDARKIVSLKQDRMCWVGIRAFNHATGKWQNNNEPERASVIAWRDMPDPARGFWSHGKFYLPRDTAP